MWEDFVWEDSVQNNSLRKDFVSEDFVCKDLVWEDLAASVTLIVKVTNESGPFHERLGCPFCILLSPLRFLGIVTRPRCHLPSVKSIVKVTNESEPFHERLGRC